MNDEYLKSEEYKKKYEDLLQRCADFMKDFAPPSPYELGFKAGWEEARKQYDKTYVPDTTKQEPARTMDLQWPRDKMAWPWPPTIVPTIPFQACGVCGMGDINKAMAYVCNNPQCPTRVTCTSTTGTTT